MSSMGQLTIDNINILRIKESSLTLNYILDIHLNYTQNYGILYIDNWKMFQYRIVSPLSIRIPSTIQLNCIPSE